MLAIAGGKGGCGKTTTAVGIARALARRERSPLVVGADTDVPDLRRLVGIPPQPSTDALPGRTLDRVVHRPADLPGVAAVPAGTPDRSAAALGCARQWLGPVLVDCPPGCDGHAAAPLRACDRALVVTTDRPQSREDARKTARLVRKLGAKLSGTAVRLTGNGTADVNSRGVLPPVVARIPEASSPLSDPRTRNAYAVLARALFEGPDGSGARRPAGRDSRTG
ncbi:MAG: cell division inhibitor MinD [Haloarculaceae archaeon]